MASVFVDGKGITKLQFTDVAGSRRTISLGGMKPTQAAVIGEKIDSLVSSAISGQPVERNTSKWLADLSPWLEKKLVRAGLITPAESPDQAAALTLGAFADRFIDGRPDVKERTLANYKQARNRLVEFFGSNRLLTEITQLDADE